MPAMHPPFPRLRHGLSACLLAALATAAGAETLTVSRATEVRADRFIDAPALGSLRAGQKVESLRNEAGWVQVQAEGQRGWVRAMALQGGAAPVVAGVARVESGRSGANNVMSTTGIRSLPKASRHALVLAVADYGPAGIADLPGAARDAEHARQIAQALGVAEGNLTVLRDGQATAQGLRGALRELESRVRPGDRVFVSFAGHGTRAGTTCAPAWLAADGQALPHAEVASLLAPVAAKADKLLVLSDTGLAPGAAGGPRARFAPLAATPACATPDPTALAAQLAATGLPAENLVVVAASGSDGPAYEDSTRGGLLTSAWRECLQGAATDSDASGSLSVGEINRCAQDRISQALGAGITAPRLAASGNLAFVPSVASGKPPAAAAMAAGPRPSELLAQIHAQRDGLRPLNVEALPKVLRIDKDPLNLVLTSPRSGYVYIALAGSDQESLYLLYPNTADTDNHITAHTSLVLPRPHWRVLAGGPAGNDTVLVMVTDAPRDLSQLAGDKAGPFVKTLLTADGKSRLQWLLGQSENADQSVCQQGGRTRNITVQVANACSDAFASSLLQIEER